MGTEATFVLLKTIAHFAGVACVASLTLSHVRCFWMRLPCVRWKRRQAPNDKVEFVVKRPRCASVSYNPLARQLTINVIGLPNK